MKYRSAVAAIVTIAVIIAACADSDRGASPISTEPGQQNGVHYVTRGKATIFDPRTGKPVPVKPMESTAGVGASIVSSSGVGETVTFPSTAPGIGSFGGTGTVSFVDQQSHHHMLALLYSRIGGPPVAMQHYVDGSIVSTSAYTWQLTPTGYVRTRSLLQVVRGGTLYGSYTTTTAPIRGPGGGPAQPVRFEHRPPTSPFQRVVGAVAYGLAFSLAPEDASAQAKTFITTCQQDYLKYSVAAALVIGVGLTIVEAPSLTPMLTTQMISAMTGLAFTEDLLLDCIVGHMSFSGMRGIGSSGGRSQPPPAECMMGSYAPQCSTPFTL
ncbi:MAG: hypothetical protein ABI884_06340 [Gemmatimonadota bacterium]